MNWSGENSYAADADAFIFNMNSKYTPIDPNKAIFKLPNGFSFGNHAFSIIGDVLNEANKGKCDVGNGTFYNLVGDEQGVSPLTGL